ncbi:hypothetical protein ACFU7X_14145 [Streptomyces chartreusis]|uniref:hypothetical protein n=1 Tax=Streptomyces chartreusis TaxID=1969 RepID=UPI003673825D
MPVVSGTALDIFTSASHRRLVKVPQGLRAHDEEAASSSPSPRNPQEPQRDQAQPSQYIGTPPENGVQEGCLLLRFAAPRDPQLVADWVSFNVIDTEWQDWAALNRYTEREGHARLPMGHKEGA